AIFVFHQIPCAIESRHQPCWNSSKIPQEFGPHGKRGLHPIVETVRREELVNDEMNSAFRVAERIYRALLRAIGDVAARVVEMRPTARGEVSIVTANKVRLSQSLDVNRHDAILGMWPNASAQRPAKPVR